MNAKLRLKYIPRRYCYARATGVGLIAALLFALDIGHSEELAEAARWIRS